MDTAIRKNLIARFPQLDVAISKNFCQFEQTYSREIPYDRENRLWQGWLWMALDALTGDDDALDVGRSVYTGRVRLRSGSREEVCGDTLGEALETLVLELAAL